MTRWLLAALLSISGCAFALSGPDPGRPRNKLPECDNSKSLVVLDSTMAAAMGVLTLSLVSEPEPAIALLPLAIGALYLGGAVKGNSSVNQCRAAMKEYSDGYSGERFAGRGAPDEDEDEDDDEDDNGKRRRRVQPRLPPQQTSAQQMPAQQMPAQQMPPQQAPPQQAPPQHMYPPPPPAQQMPPQQMPPQQMPPQQMPPQQMPPQQPPAKGKPPAKGQRPPAPAGDDDWTDFWREVP